MSRRGRVCAFQGTIILRPARAQPALQGRTIACEIKLNAVIALQVPRPTRTTRRISRHAPCVRQASTRGRAPTSVLPATSMLPQNPGARACKTVSACRDSQVQMVGTVCRAPRASTNRGWAAPRAHSAVHFRPRSLAAAPTFRRVTASQDTKTRAPTSTPRARAPRAPPASTSRRLRTKRVPRAQVTRRLPMRPRRWWPASAVRALRVLTVANARPAP